MTERDHSKDVTLYETVESDLPCAGYEGCRELEGVMYDFFAHDPACPKSPEQKRARAATECTECDGSGWVDGDDCQQCGGSGEARKSL